MYEKERLVLEHDVYGKAYYDLAELKDLIQRGCRIVRDSAMTDAVLIGYSSIDEVLERVLKLRKCEIYKNMEADKCPGLRQDVYRTYDEDEDGNKINLYIKLQKSPSSKAVVISFKLR